jgi:hypothetical protein
MEKRLDKTLKENVKLKSLLDKNIHPFIDWSEEILWNLIEIIKWINWQKLC